VLRPDFAECGKTLELAKMERQQRTEITPGDVN
jgi:hypothetical protein